MGRDGLLSESLRPIGVQTLSFSTRPCRGYPHGFVAVIPYRVRRNWRAWSASAVVLIMKAAPVGCSPIVVSFAVSFRLSRRGLHCRVSRRRPCAAVLKVRAIAIDVGRLWQPGAGFRSERHRPASVEIVDHH